jgi:hypothetical protein
MIHWIYEGCRIPELVRNKQDCCRSFIPDRRVIKKKGIALNKSPK